MSPQEKPNPEPNRYTSAAFPWGCHWCDRVFTHARFLARHVTFLHLAGEPHVDPQGTYADPSTDPNEKE